MKKLAFFVAGLLLAAAGPVLADVKDDSGNITKWQSETGAPVELMRRGWRKDSLKEGQEATMRVFRAKDGANTGTARGVLLPNGMQVFSGSSTDGGPQVATLGRGPSAGKQ
jgi:hypothetical protein